MVTAKAKALPKAQPNYKHAGPYDRPTFQAEFTAQFAKSPRHNAAAVPDMLVLLPEQGAFTLLFRTGFPMESPNGTARSLRLRTEDGWGNA